MADQKNPQSPERTERQPVQGGDPGTTLPVDQKKTPTVDELHDRLPKDAPGRAETDEQFERRQKAEKDYALNPAHLPGLHRESEGGPLVADDEHDPGINANIVS